MTRPENVEEFDTCDVCGRTMLRGERTETYLDGDGAPRNVCVLCRPRVEHLGWVSQARAEHGHGSRGAGSRERRGRIGGKLRSRFRDRPRTEQAEAPDQGALEEAPVPEPAAVADPDVSEPEEAAAGAKEEGEATPPGRAPRRRRAVRDRVNLGQRRQTKGVHAVPTDPQVRFERALEMFNTSDYFRTVTSISRSLGSPKVSVGSLAGSASEVRVTVAWDLSWYQWSVDLSDPGDPARRLGQGSEVEELDGPARQWNAHVDPEGRLQMGPAQALPAVPLEEPAEDLPEA